MLCGVNNGMKVLLLGASGLLGHNVLRLLIESGNRVVALVRRVDALRLGGDYEVRLGSLLDYPTLLAAAEGCDAVINCAGVTDMSLRRGDYTAVNTTLCASLLEVMKRLGKFSALFG